MRDSWRHFVAEFVGTFGLVFVGGAAIMVAAQTQAASALLDVAVAHGLILSIMVTATMRISGHLNPAVTIGFLVTRRIEPMMGMLYIVAQLLGALLGDRKSTRLNSSHPSTSYAVFCLKKKMTHS